MKYSKFSHKTKHLKGKYHVLDPNLDLKHLVHHSTVQYVDRDADGDVDIYDNPKKGIPDENVSSAKNAEKMSKRLLAKQKGELKHTKVGVAFEDLRNWFDKDHPEGNWKRYNTKGEAIGPCAREPGESKPKCLSNEKAKNMTKPEIASAVKRKREEDPVANRSGKGGKPKMVSNKIQEQSDEKRYCPMCRKRERRMDCSYGPAMWDAVTIGGIKESKKPEPDHEHSMARSELATIEKAVKRLKTKMKGEGNIEAWVQSKITKAADYIDSAADYLDSGEHDVQGSMDEAKKGPCWKGYRKKPGKADYEKGSCVKVSEASFEISPKHRQVNRDAKIRERTKTGDEGSKIALTKVKGPNIPLVRKGDTRIRNMNAGYEPSIVDKILLEMEAEVLTEKNKPTNPKLWAKWKAKAKAKFDVYPSAYANGWAAKGYKSEGGGWKSVNENSTIEDANGKTFVEIIDLVKVNNESCDTCEKCGKSPCECENKEKKYYGGSSAKPGPNKNYVKPMGEDVNEAVRIPAKTGNLLFINLTWRGKYYGVKVFFPYTKIPNRREVQDEIQKIYPGSRVYSFQVSDYKPGEIFIQTEDWQSANRKDRTDGMSKDTVKKYRQENPDSKLQTAVTEKNPTGNRAKRQNSYCKRSEGQKNMHNIDCTETPDKPICKARRRWNCKGDS